MPHLSKEQTAAQYDNNTIYILLNTRDSRLPGFHWGIFITTETPVGEYWHAVNRDGAWDKENKSIDISALTNLVMAYKFQAIDSDKGQICRETLSAVTADGSPSRYTGDTFNCQAWVYDALLSLKEKGLINFSVSLPELGGKLTGIANGFKDEVESGGRSAEVLNTKIHD